MSRNSDLIFNIYRDGELLRTERLNQDVIKVGSHDKAELSIDDPAVSRVHALIERGPDGVFIMDLGSGRGTMLNGVRVGKALLSHGDRIQLGSVEIQFLTHERRARVVPAAEVVPDAMLYASRFLSKPASTDGSVEIAILYRDFVMHEEIHQPPRSVTIGSGEKVTYGIEHATAGESFELISVPAGGGEPLLQFASGMEGEIYVDTQRMTLAEARRNGTAEVSGQLGVIELRQATRARIVFGDVVFFIHRSTRPVVALPLAPGALQGLGYTLASVLLHSLFLALVFLLPPDVGRLSLDGFSQQDRFVQLLMQDMQEEEAVPDWLLDEEDQMEAEAGEEGEAGDERADEVDAQMAVEQTEATPEQLELAREAVQDRGAMSVLNEVGPTSLFGEQASGFDDLMAIGSVTGDDMGAAYGTRGLGRFGAGLSSGGTGTRAGFGTGLAIGGDPRLGRELRQVRGPEEREVIIPDGDPEVIGQLDRAIIQRVVREHRREVRACYEAELQRNPELRGRVTIAFVIAPDGTVARADVAESSMNNRTVESCVTTRMRRWRFPEPRGGGIVRVSYPFDFST